MWTPRRVLLLILGVVLFGAAFGVYLRFLGWIDGLPQLPDEFLGRRAETEPFPSFAGSFRRYSHSGSPVRASSACTTPCVLGRYITPR